jgi:hypothetical protein
MDAKLTLKLDSVIIEKAKEYAKENNVSLSKMIENYLQAISIRKDEMHDISPLVENLTGVISLDNEDYKKDYSEFLNRKYS